MQKKIPWAHRGGQNINKKLYQQFKNINNKIYKFFVKDRMFSSGGNSII